MTWIKKNNVLNSKVTTLPVVVGSHYTEGSVVVVSGDYGEVEWCVVNGAWKAIRALTDLFFYINPSGVDLLTNGGISTPLQSLRYVTTVLIPKQVKNVTIYLVSFNDETIIDDVGELNGIIRTKDTDIISIIGYTTIPTLPETITLGLGEEEVTYFQGALREYEAISTSLIHTVVHSGGVVTLGTDPITNRQYIAWPFLNFKGIGISGGQKIYNTLSGEQTFITDLVQDGQSYLYLKSPIFTNDADNFEIVAQAETVRWIQSTTSGTCYPISLGSKDSIYVLNRGVRPVPGDHSAIKLQQITLSCINLDVQVNLKRLLLMDRGVSGRSYESSFYNCSRPIISTETEFDTLRLHYTPEFITNRSVVRYGCNVHYSQTTTPISHRKSTGYFELDDLILQESMDLIYDTGILFYTTYFDVTWLSVYKSTVTIKNSLLDFAKFESDVASRGIVNLTDGYLRIDSENVIMNTNDNIGSVAAFKIEKGGVIDSRGGSLTYLNVSQILIGSSSKGIYGYEASKTYDVIEDLLSERLAPDGVIGISKDQPGNVYIRVNNKWVIRAGNQYSSEEFEAMFAVPNIIVPNGLEIFNTTIGREMTWTEQAQAQ